MDNSIEKKFTPRYKGTAQFISDYEDFGKVEIGNNLGVLAQGRGNEFGAFFEGRELKQEFQLVLLQQKCVINDGPIINKSNLKVVEYKLPLTGNIYLDDFIKGKIKEYPVN